ncbi:glycosyltransferase [Nocardia jejuensis]|uniref:glycosyltransferase n=1 Tax=Nocardia jejuensis TaxID=328049 RepID=UPI001FDEC51E|nr:glycosyltransferase [Nocardia jejuensis]
MALVNRLGVRQLHGGAHTVIEPVTVCVPARNEAERLPELIADLRAQQGVPRLRVLILDDASTDRTYAAAADAIGHDERFTLLHNDSDPPQGWTGKTTACARLADFAGFGVDETGRAGTAPGEFRAEGDAPEARPESVIALLTRQPGTGDDPAATRRGRHRRADDTPPDLEDRDAPGALVFLDADVRLEPGALAAAVGELRRARAALVCPWPAQQAETGAERLVQPLLCWSWASTLPVPVSNRSLRPSTAVACGQFLVFDAAAYRGIGGHLAVADQVTEDLAIARELRRAGRRTTLVAAGRLARTRMYRGAAELDTGYTRWLWSAYGGPAGSLAVGGVAALAFWAPPLAAILGRGPIRRVGLLGYTAAVTTRLLARSTETGTRPDRTDLLAALAHPASVAAYARLSARSHRAHRHGALSWKGRRVSL